MKGLQERPVGRHGLLLCVKSRGFERGMNFYKIGEVMGKSREMEQLCSRQYWPSTA